MYNYHYLGFTRFFKFGRLFPIAFFSSADFQSNFDHLHNSSYIETPSFEKAVDIVMLIIGNHNVALF